MSCCCCWTNMVVTQNQKCSFFVVFRFGGLGSSLKGDPDPPDPLGLQWWLQVNYHQLCLRYTFVFSTLASSQQCIYMPRLVFEAFKLQVKMMHSLKASGSHITSRFLPYINGQQITSQGVGVKKSLWKENTKHKELCSRVPFPFFPQVFFLHSFTSFFIFLQWPVNVACKIKRVEPKSYQLTHISSIRVHDSCGIYRSFQKRIFIASHSVIASIPKSIWALPTHHNHFQFRGFLLFFRIFKPWGYCRSIAWHAKVIPLFPYSVYILMRAHLWKARNVQTSPVCFRAYSFMISLIKKLLLSQRLGMLKSGDSDIVSKVRTLTWTPLIGSFLFP